MHDHRHADDLRPLPHGRWIWSGGLLRQARCRRGRRLRNWETWRAHRRLVEPPDGRWLGRGGPNGRQHRRPLPGRRMMRPLLRYVRSCRRRTP